MAISMQSLHRSGTPKPPRALVYGPHGIGKTSLLAGAPNPVFLQTEDGLGMIEAPTFGVLTSYEAVIEAVSALLAQPHDFQTLVLDTVDWLEPLIWGEACRVNGWANIEAAGFGKGYAAAIDIWRSLLAGINMLRDERNMAIVFVAHAETKRFEAPETNAYDRYQPKLQARASALLQEHVDCAWFINYRVSIVKDDPKDKNSRTRAAGGGQRVLYTTERPSHLAKNRYRMPDTILLPDEPSAMWTDVASHIPFYKQPLAERN